MLSNNYVNIQSFNQIFLFFCTRFSEWPGHGAKTSILWELTLLWCCWYQRTWERTDTRSLCLSSQEEIPVEISLTLYNSSSRILRFVHNLIILTSWFGWLEGILEMVVFIATFKSRREPVLLNWDYWFQLHYTATWLWLCANSNAYIQQCF